jgi:AcrR family transcriptional regulator
MAERQDAARNRAAILDAARALLSDAEADGELRLSAVAKRAGVGQGTLYRHFPDRDALVGAVYEREILALVALAHELVETHPPAEALRAWLTELASYARVKLGVMAAVDSSVWSEVSSRTPSHLAEALTALLGAGAADGSLRGDVEPRDVVLLSWFLAHVEPAEWDDRVPRLLDVLLRGLS